MESEVNEIGPGAASDAFDWHQRRLCSDESCIGVIGPDGRCKECGKPYAGAAAGGDAEVPRPEPLSEPSGPPAVSDEMDAPDDEWAARRLCSDESCIGVIGPDGRCRECGKPFSG
jgi:hypothetical protein